MSGLIGSGMVTAEPPVLRWDAVRRGQLSGDDRLRTNWQETITLASYDWIDLRTSGDYDHLTKVLDPDFGPQEIIQCLKSQVINATKGMLVEHEYVDKDYRSTFYNL